MEKLIPKFTSFEGRKDEEYRYWQSLTPAECFAAGHQMSVVGVPRLWPLRRWSRT